MPRDMDAGTEETALCCWYPRLRTLSLESRDNPALPQCAWKGWIEFYKDLFLYVSVIF